MQNTISANASLYFIEFDDVRRSTHLCLADDAVCDRLVDADDAVGARVVHARDDEALRLADRLLAHLLLEVRLHVIACNDE